MPRPINRVHNQETGEVIDREMNDEEYNLFLEAQAIREQQKAEAEAKEQARLVAQAKLEALGLTVEDLQALGL